MDSDRKIIQWGILDFDLPKPYDVKDFVDRVWSSLLQFSDDNVRVVVERQRDSTGGQLNHSPTIKYCNYIELLLHASFREAPVCVSVEPQLIASLYNLPSTVYNEKKQAAVNLVTGFAIVGGFPSYFRGSATNSSMLPIPS